MWNRIIVDFPDYGSGSCCLYKAKKQNNKKPEQP